MKRRGKAPVGWWGEVSSGGGGDKKGKEVGGLQQWGVDWAKKRNFAII